MLLNKDEKCRVLVLCTGNSARSIMAEALFNTHGREYFRAYSAGSNPTGVVNPLALEQISELQLDYEPRSKSWEEFFLADAPALDIALTVCGNASQAICQHFPSSIEHVHWGLPDPAAVTSNQDDSREAFSQCFDVFQRRVAALVNTIADAAREPLHPADLMRTISN